jgi:hypothetical protein
MTIAEFLLARIAEDEDDAERILYDEGGMNFRPHSAHVLAECEAKRRIAVLHLPTASHRWCISCTHIDALPPNNVEAYPCRTLLALASVYADHPDFDPDWRI